MKDYKALDKKYIANTYARFDVVFTQAKGSLIYDEEGKEYIDMGSGIAVNTFGFCDDIWANAVNDQINKLNHISNLYYSTPQIELAETLCELTNMKKVFFANSGAEANECAIKAARKYSNDRYGEKSERNIIISLNNSFHGRTIATISATGQDVFHKHFHPFLGSFVFADAENIDEIKAHIEGKKVCAIIIELIQGEGGVNSLSKEYVKDIEKIAKENDVLLIIDEVQTGNGRTGTLFAFEQYDIKPDIVTTAKGLGGGLPIGACLFNEKTEDVLDTGSHGSTFGGNPICAAGALSIIKRLDDKLFDEVLEKNEYIKSSLSSCKNVISISGLGLMLGIECTKEGKDLVNACLKRGVAALSAKNKLRLLPALNIPMPLLEKAVEIIKDEIDK